MESINGERRSGRTTSLIYISAITGQPILTPSLKQAAFVEAVARELGVEIPRVRSYQEIVLARRRGCRDYQTGRGYMTFKEIDRRGGFLIDNADELFEALLSEKLGAKIAAITICAPVAMKERYCEKLDEAKKAREGAREMQWEEQPKESEALKAMAIGKALDEGFQKGLREAEEHPDEEAKKWEELARVLAQELPESLRFSLNIALPKKGDNHGN